MANNCNNFIYFNGDDSARVNDMFQRAMEYNDETQHGWLPEDDDIKALDYQHYLFDVERQDTDAWRCWTKWSPPIDELCIISMSFPSVKFYMEWDEPGMALYGRCKISNGVVTSLVELADEDLEQVSYDDENNLYKWNRPDGSVESYECEYDIYEEMLDGKEGVR